MSANPGGQAFAAGEVRQLAGNPRSGNVERENSIAVEMK
jgi:hypothetical protein